MTLSEYNAAQADLDDANPETVFCFDGKAFKQAKMLVEARKYGSGILSVINGDKILEEICF